MAAPAVMRGDRRYDEIVASGREREAAGGAGLADRKLVEKAMWNSATTPEEVLAAQLASGASMRMVDHNEPGGDWWAVVRWPWGDARGLLRAKGRTYDEARLRLRDKLVRDARKLVSE